MTLANIIRGGGRGRAATATSATVSVCPLVATHPVAEVAVAGIKEFDERAALVEEGAGVPRDWAEGFASLDCAKPPTGITPSRWRQVIDDGGRFLDVWAQKAAALGWSALDVFGVNPAGPAVRYDGMGLVPLIGGHRVVAITADSARIESGPGRFQTYRRRPSPGAVALWELIETIRQPDAEGQALLWEIDN